MHDQEQVKCNLNVMAEQLSTNVEIGYNLAIESSNKKGLASTITKF